MAVDVFMKIDGIPGESSDAQFKDCIEVLTLDWEVTRPMGGERAAGAVNCSSFAITKVVDKATPLILKAATMSERINEIKITLCRAGKEKVKFLEYLFTNCVITKATLMMGEQSGETLPVENVHFRFATIEITYFQQTRDSGGSRGQIVNAWSPSNWS